MRKWTVAVPALLGGCLISSALVFSCGDKEGAEPEDKPSGGGETTGGSTTGDTTDDDGNGDSCALVDNTEVTGTADTLGCAIITRDTSSCEAERTAQGLSGFWLKFSCRVTLTKSDANVAIAVDSRPDYKSPYFGSTDGCYEALSATGRKANPNTIKTQSFSIAVPFAPTVATTPVSTTGATIGIALNGVSIFGNFAAPGDNIYEEAQSFDKCEGHPQNTGVYHYHTEPTSISQADSAFVGVMRDGFPVYGRKDMDDSDPVLDSAGGHTGVTPDSDGASVYHYHVNLQTDGTDSAWFISKGYFSGTPGTCTGCN